MSYLQDRKVKKTKTKKIVLGVIVLVFIFYFGAKVSTGLSYVTHKIFQPVFTLGNSAGQKLKNFSSFFYSKESLFMENENLKSQLQEKDATLADHNSIMEENSKLKEILGRKSGNENMILSAILSKPNLSPYDTLLIDIGSDKGIIAGEKVFALGNIPIGRIAEVYASTSKVILFSNPGEKTEVVAPFGAPPITDTSLTEIAPAGKSIFMQAVGRGGGNFEMILPRDFSPAKGTEIRLPGITPYVIGVVSTIVSDPRDAFTKALLVSPVNVQELEFVQVIK